MRLKSLVVPSSSGDDDDLHTRRRMLRRELWVAEKHFKLSSAGKKNVIINPKSDALKAVMILLLLLFIGTVLALLSSLNACRRNTTSDAISELSGSPSDHHQYRASLSLNWETMSSILSRMPKQNKLDGGRVVGLLNFDSHEIRRWKHLLPTAHFHVLRLDHVDTNTTWESLYPEWIDEEEEKESPKCPSFPTIDVENRRRLDLLAVKLPCQNRGSSSSSWSKNIPLLHLQIAAANSAASSYEAKRPLYLMIILTKGCFPLLNLFTCRDLVAREGETWLYRPSLSSLRQKLDLPTGSCQLSLPSETKRLSISQTAKKQQREAYATILHSVYTYVCGAIAVAHSIRMSGSTRDLVILVDASINEHHRRGLEAAGWQVRTIERIRNPNAEKDSYNEWNYSKFRLWQLTDYDKIIFIDSDMLILRNIDVLFRMPEISATGNNGSLFNSGVMVIEPSNCTFQLVMDHIHEIHSYNGGDQGFLNEMFPWWHRIPQRMNFLKHFWPGDDEETRRKKLQLFSAEPPIVYVLHFLGYKPWQCFRDYDCNWNVERLQEFASDAAHRRWWKMHDSMPEKLQRYCLLRTIQKAQLEWDRREAEKGNYSDGHWKMEVKDDRIDKCIDRDCSWRGMLRHWEIKN